MRYCLGIVTGVLSVVLTTGLMAQAPVAPAKKPAEVVAPSRKIEIPDEPRAIDPVTLMPPALAQRVTHEFKKTSLRDLVKWLQQEQKLTVIVDTQALADERIPISQPVSDHLNNEPLYLLLDRLSGYGLAWYVADENLHLTTVQKAQEHYVTMQYNIGDLLDAGFQEELILNTIEQSTRGSWDADEPGTGTLVLLGDVLFVRQTDSMQREVSSLLTALLKHGRRTRLLDCPQNAVLREKLDQRISVNFEETSLEEVVAQFAALTQADIRLDRSLLVAGLTDRPITLLANEQKLSSLIQQLATGTELAPVVRDGILWIASKESARELYHTAVFDVRDLCQNNDESMALEEAILSQTAGPWDADEPGTGTLDFPVPGTMVIRQTEDQLNAALELLENYRTALRASKPRKPNVPDPQELVTHYYRMSTETANDLAKTLPLLVEPGSWKTEAAPDQPGTLLAVISKPAMDVISLVTPGKVATPTTPTQVVSTSHSVLVIRQSRETHLKIAELIHKIVFGDAGEPAAGGGAGGEGRARQQGGQGGFGQGFFQIDP